MIARIRGTLLEADFTGIIVDVNGVGYQLFIPMSTFDCLPQPGKAVDLLVVTHVREDAITLYGFSSREEKQLFEILTSVNGVGAKLALNILSSMPTATFCTAILNADLKTIGRISGIGKKTAERLVVELRDRLAKLHYGLATAGVSDGKEQPFRLNAAAEDATMALEQLGFKRDGIRKVIQQLLNELDPAECSAENLIRKALQQLNG